MKRSGLLLAVVLSGWWIPATQQQYVVAAGKNYYWLPQGSDRPFGTNNTDRPNIDAPQLLEVR